MRNSGAHRIGVLATLLLPALSLRADPIVIGEGPPRVEAVVPILLAVLIEAICIRLLLRRWRRPALFILWLIGMHLLTYPLFLWVLWLCWGLHPALGVFIGEGTIVLVEAVLIYLICCFVSSDKSSLPVPSFSKTLVASFIGNICSAVSYPLLLIACGMAYSAVSSISSGTD